MSEPTEDEVVRRLRDAVDGPRPLPAELREALTALLSVDDPVSGLADRPVGVPRDLHARLQATLASAPVPLALRSRIRQHLLPARAPGTAILRVAAVVVAVLLVAGGLAFGAAARRDGAAQPDVDLAIEPADDRGREPGGDDVGGLEGGSGDSTGLGVAAEAPTTTAAAPSRTAPASRRPPPPAGDGHLVAFDSCEDLLGRTKAAALEAVGPYGLDDGRHVGFTTTAQRPAAATAEGGDTAGGMGGGEDFSGTNVQEAGVDEPDIVKSDGGRIVVVDGATLRVVRDDGSGPRVIGALELPEGARSGELLVHGDRALVFGWTRPDAAPAGGPAMRYAPSLSAVWTVDLRNAERPRLETTLVVDGVIAAARLVDGTVRIAVTTTGVGPEWVYPTEDTDAARRRALEENQRLVRESSLEDWVPTYRQYEGASASPSRTGRLCACGDTLRPAGTFAGADTVSVLTIDPQRPDLPPQGSAAVQGWAETLYASKANLFVATRDFSSRFELGAPIALHRFDISDRATAVYRGSGEVLGTPLNQFALSERNGHLRIATTTSGTPETGGASASAVTVLAIRDDRLERVGAVGGLGRGERITSVRFLDDVGYVVTFRQTDPLYTIDLRDPTNPRMRGELKIPGFSAYLHPTDDGRLLGVGQDADEDGRSTGAQVSSFDVRSLDAPKETTRISYGPGSWSEVQSDHHAFLYWPAARRAMVPVVRSESFDGSSRPSSWVSVLSVPTDGHIVEAGRVTHDGRPGGSKPDDWGGPMIRRSFVIGDVLYTLSSVGILASDLQSLSDRSWLAF